MKPKTARRFLTRNGIIITKVKIDKMKFSGFTKTCLKVLRNDMRKTKNKASIRVHNKIMCIGA